MNPEKHPLQFKTPDLKKPDNVQELAELSPEDKTKIQQITIGIDAIPNEIKQHASEDIIKTLESNHSLNKIWRDEQGQIIGYLAFEDFKPHEAYAKYFATDGTTSENPFSLIPEIIDNARELGYQKIHFHGFNPRLNKVLEHFGFVRTHTDKQGSFSADHFEINLNIIQDEQTEQKTKELLENKYLAHILKETEKTIQTLDEEKKKTLEQTYSDLIRRLENQELADVSKTILKLKLARYLQRYDTIDTNTLYDAIIETPKFIEKDKGGFDRLLEIHEEKTLIKIAEMRKRKAEQTGNEQINPYEALFQTNSGEYYVARLLNMPHLEEESQYMDHCVGTSDSYINKMKRGDVEILSFRKTPKINPKTQKLEGDEPLITIEYNVRTKEIQQIKKHSDAYIQESDPFFQDFIEALKRLKETEHDTGEKRNFKEISKSELQNIKVKDYYLFTEQGEVYFKDFDPESNIFVLKMGNMPITNQTPKEDACLIMKIVENIEVQPEQLATNKDEVNENTKAYIGIWNPTIYQTIKNYPNITHLYESFPDKKIFIYELTTNPDIQSPEQAKQKLESKGIWISDYGKDLLDKTEFSKEQTQYKLVQFTVEQLGFTNGGTIDEIYTKAQELGLKLCPAEVGPLLRLAYEGKDWKLIAMKQIAGLYGYPDVFDLGSGDAKLRLDGNDAYPGGRWDSDGQFVFLAS